MNRFFLIAIVSTAFGAFGAQSVPAQNSSVPILIELFTSEGCSSCPPAENWLQQIDASQPVRGAQVIVLSEHVDYWDHDGWKDPYSSAQMTDRQKEYVEELGLSGPYTPQLVVDGKTELHLDRPDQVGGVLQAATKSAIVPVTIHSAQVVSGSPGQLQAHIEVDGSAVQRSADVYAAIALDHVSTDVLHGENGGRHLTHVAVVQEIVKVGKMEKGKIFSHDFQSKLTPQMNAKDMRLVVFVQEPGARGVVGAAMQKIAAIN